ncbi:hypothetical protein [Prochlorothrix hollandica]|uniref:hypothetical protein n=1 Tax=Prochlorothrix hollandica TaxID=1223 RepID=UPI00034DDCDD|nr:hypothetical protein [Prochlorothrix hollandica]
MAIVKTAKPIPKRVMADFGQIQQSEMGHVGRVFRAHPTQRVSAIEILTTDLGLL